MGEPKTLRFYDFRIWGRVQTPHKTNIIHFWRHQDTKNKARRNLDHLRTNMCYENKKVQKSKMLTLFEKAGTNK